MSDEHVDALRRARQELVEARRRLAIRMADNPDVSAEGLAAPMIQLQQAIDAIDAAIKDEESMHPPQPGMDKMAERYTAKTPKGIV